jgi:hypothetical protein
VCGLSWLRDISAEEQFTVSGFEVLRGTSAELSIE